MTPFAVGRGCALAVILVLTGCNNAVPPTAPDAVLVNAGTNATPAATGTASRWTGVGHAATGTVRISVENGVGRLDFSADFSVSAVPGPFVYVNTTNNANTGRPLRISALKSTGGAQSYLFQLPAGMSYSYVLVWCDPYNVPVAEASVTPTP